MRLTALLIILLLVLPGCGFTKAISIGTGAVGVLGTTSGFIVLYYTGKHSMPNEDAQAARATKKGYMRLGRAHRRRPRLSRCWARGCSCWQRPSRRI